MKTPTLRHGGFSLLELLVVIAVIAVLAALLLPCLARARHRARLIEELSAGRQLMLAVQMYANDNDGAMFPGYAAEAGVVDDLGQPVHFPLNARYPWRIAPYLSGSMPLLYSGENRARLTQLKATRHEDYVYSVSLYPSLGINACFMGGNQSEFPADAANSRFGTGTVVTRIDEVRRPGELLVFASARSAANGDSAHGYYQVTPPFLRNRQWASAYSPALAPGQWGFVAHRFNRRAVAAMVDGHAESLSLTEMQDMRHWCNRADRPAWTLPP